MGILLIPNLTAALCVMELTNTIETQFQLLEKATGGFLNEVILFVKSAVGLQQQDGLSYLLV